MSKRICIFTTINADGLLELLKRLHYPDEAVERNTLIRVAHGLLNDNAAGAFTDEMIICEITKIQMLAKKQMPADVKPFVKKRIVIFDDCDSTVAIYIQTGEQHVRASNHVRPHRSDRKL